MEENPLSGSPNPEERPVEHVSKFPTKLVAGVATLALISLIALYLLLTRKPEIPVAPAPVAPPPELSREPEQHVDPVAPTTPLEVKRPKPPTAPADRGVAKVPHVERHNQPQGEEAETEELTEETIQQAREFELPEKPKIDVNSPEMLIQPQK